ncbi:MAG: NAD(P)/FAD-dependent oxidoreductase [Bacteroidota bacterium]|nr:NAD(P)/FAD-dependent oxidoreductase [Bacteroidota bacterium]
MKTGKKIYDCIIIGGGPSGLTCAIYLARFQRSVAVIDNGKYRNHASRGVHGYLGYDGIKPARLIKLALKEASYYGVEIIKGTAKKFDKIKEHWEVRTTENKKFRSEKIVLAYGVRDILPAIRGFKKYYGKYIFHCPVCDGYEVRRKTVGIIGEIAKVESLAYELQQWADQIIIFTNGSKEGSDTRPCSRLKKHGIEVNEEKLKSFNVKNNTDRYVITYSGNIISVDYLFFSIEVCNSCSLAEDIDCSMNDTNNNILTNRKFETSLKGVFAIGDLVEGPQLVVKACASGAVAAIEINRQILKQELAQKSSRK